MHGYKITSKGQVTIPNELREQYGFLPHTKVIFKEDKKGRVYLIKADYQNNEKKQSRGQQIVEHLKGKSSVKMTTDEIMALTRKK